MSGRFRRWLAARIPDRAELARNRWLGWLGPRLAHPRLWHVNRRGIALGLAIGLFFGLLIPLAQIPLAVVVAVAMRANVPTAIASTLVTNPVTFAPIYVLAYQLGAMLLGHAVPASVSHAAIDAESADALVQIGLSGWLAGWFERVMAAGRPLLLGLLILASLFSLLGYLLVSWSWRLRTMLHRRRRQRERRAR